MPEFIWEGRTSQGGVQKGEMEGTTEAAIRMTLRSQGIQITKIKPKPKDIFASLPIFQKKVQDKDIIVFTRQFATLIDAGLPLVQGLEILSSQEENKAFKKILIQVKSDVEGGSTLADALKKHPKVFDNLYVNLVAAGEVGGVLDTILARLAAYYEKAAKLRSRVKGAFTYPIVVLVIAFAVIIVLLVFVIPVFQKMFADFGGTLPGLTQMVVNLSSFMRKYIIFLLFGIGVVILAFRTYHKTNAGRLQVDRLVLKLPVFGPLLKKTAVANFTRTLGTMMTSGVPILDGLDIVARTVNNKIVQMAILDTRKSISEGKSIAEPLSRSGVFPPMVVQMVSVGESTGALDAMLAKIADFYDEEVDASVEALTKLIEPFMMIFLGGTVGTMLAAMYLPIFKMAGAIE
ncbi:MAG TPA: type II secretion system F family protein [Thermodesulfobacteriota bacterium]|nr:type II secretion system F family protein [Thermodesulfobacteriota bacterium]